MYIEQLSSIDNIIIPFKNYNEFASNYIFPIIIKNSTYRKRDDIRNKLAEVGIQTSVHYPAVHKFSIYSRFMTKLSLTEFVSDTLITLPMFAALKREQIDFIFNSLANLLN